MSISFKRLLDEVNLTQEQLSEKVGKDRATVANYLRLLKLPPEIQLGIRQRKIGMGHARALITIGDPHKQMDLYNRIVEGQMSVRQVEEIARNKRPIISVPAAQKMTSADHKHLSKQLAGMFGTKVSVKQNELGKGRIEIGFRNDDELKRITRLLESR